jgi:thiaminase (transcriptional activator TenA)
MQDPLSARLRVAAAPLWQAQLDHPFITGIGDGSLDPDKFQHFIRQDYLFLIEYARLLAYACARAPSLDLMERFADLTQAVLKSEMDLHRSYAAAWGISADDLARERMTPTTRAYGDFLVRTASTGDYAELMAALLPCMWGYSELGRRLAERGRPPEPRYAAWIDMYASDEFAQLASWCRDSLDNIATSAASDERLSQVFVTSSYYELAFWDMAWRRERQLEA